VIRSSLSHPLRALGDWTLFVRDCARASLRHGVYPREIFRHAHNIGVKSLPILAIISIFVGTNVALQGHRAFQPLGGGKLVGLFVALAGVRELAPVITAAMVAAKAGTEMASQIGVMRIREQLDALEVMAINSRAYLVAPRMLGILLVLPALTILSILMMLLSGYAVSVFQLGLNGHEFVQHVSEGIGPIDFLYGVFKSLFFGTIICTVSCWYGFNCGDGPEGVGRATNGAVVTSAVVCVSLNYFLSEILYGGAL
jgi:phospholipid/cholesterol/gamma-HCH transport system permease protein